MEYSAIADPEGLAIKINALRFHRDALPVWHTACTKVGRRTKSSNLRGKPKWP
jgi:hypothetical protein